MMSFVLNSAFPWLNPALFLMAIKAKSKKVKGGASRKEEAALRNGRKGKLERSETDLNLSLNNQDKNGYMSTL